MLSVRDLKLILAVGWGFCQMPGKHEEFFSLSEGANINPHSGQATSP